MLLGDLSNRRYPTTHPFASLQGSDNIIAFYTKRYGDKPLIIQGAGYTHPIILLLIEVPVPTSQPWEFSLIFSKSVKGCEYLICSFESSTKSMHFALRKTFDARIEQ